ncbi:2093_t:CDS:2 [Cetraspora pellucida]|uniref:2093_t:CDS:1 n=1 Tax=Cetraspora pellucida TaxID=1433469 RepID=A0A9N9BE66_9GLOM|nr:2093_t:CDS:2 [Cetraspora pellucida]
MDYYSTYESLEENWNADPNDHEFMFTHDYLAATKARNLLEDQKLKQQNSQLVGVWEVELTPDESLNLTELRVCSNHFNFDHGQLHSSGTKQLRHYTKGVVNKKKSLLCNKYKTFFSRGNDCVDHCWNVCGRDVQVLCLGLKSCPVFRIIPKIASKFTIGDRYVRYICAKCFEKHDGHLHKHLGFGKSQTCVENNLHTEDTNHILWLFSSWLFNLSYSQNENKKEEVLRHLIKLLENPELSSLTSMDMDFNLPSPLLVKIGMKINRFNDYSSTDKKLIKVEESRQFGEMLGNTICNSHKDIEKNHPANLKQKIMAIQDERERVLLLYDEFVEYNQINIGKRKVTQYTEALWQLVDKLTFAFYHPDPTQHDLFKHAQEMNRDEKVTKGRQVKDLVNVLAKEYLLFKKE